MLTTTFSRTSPIAHPTVEYIVVVDDDPAVREGVAVLLEQAGYRVSRAASADAALAVLAEPPLPSLIILDVRMPETDGYAMCRRVRAMPSYVPVLMLSACDTLLDKVTGLELGADEYVTKPFEPPELLARVRAMLRFADQLGQRDHAALSSGQIRLDQAQHRATVRDQSVELTLKEWALLELFLQHPGQVFGREMLLQRIWGDEYAGDSRVVDMLVKRLRAKVEADPEQPRLIQTVRGFGYRFVCDNTAEC